MTHAKNVVNTEVLDFLRGIWADLSPESYVFLSVKDSAWTDYPYKVKFLMDPSLEGVHEHDTDVYFTPCAFSDNRRLRQFATGKSEWLFADLDEVDPYGLANDLRPQVAWETSPGRYQCAWRIDSPLGPRAFERLNKAMTYHVGADKGGWSWTKVLRVPGTVSTKHGEPFTVRLLWATWDEAHPTDALRTLVKPALDGGDPQSGPIRLPKATGPEIARKHWANLSPRARKLIRAKVVHQQDDRSTRLWELENLCLDAGLTVGETVRVVSMTVWNKYKGQRRELRRLHTEVSKADSMRPKQEPQPTPTKDPIPQGKVDDRYVPIRAAKYLGLSNRPPSWLVDQVWADNAHGLWAGDYKTYKSTLLMDLAISVATGTPFLDMFEVHNPGPVLVIQEENGPAFMHDKLHRISSSKGVGTQVHWDGKNVNAVSLGTDFPVSMLNQKRFNLTDDEDLRWLDKYLTAHPHKLVILDPMYKLMPGIDENSAQELAPPLNWLATLSLERNTSIILAHHYNKGNDPGKRHGHRVSGSGILNRWWASAVYAERHGDPADNTIKFSFEHRDHPNLGTKTATVIMQEDNADHYHVVVQEVTHDGLDEEVNMDMDPMRPKRRSHGIDDGVGPLDKLIEGEVVLLSDIKPKFPGLSDGGIIARIERSDSYQMVYVSHEGKRRRAIARIK